MVCPSHIPVNDIFQASMPVCGFQAGKLFVSKEQQMYGGGNIYQVPGIGQYLKILYINVAQFGCDVFRRY